MPDMLLRPIRLAHAYPLTLVVLIVGLALRAVLLPIGHGTDFSQQELAERFTLAGLNVYTHPPHAKAINAYAYFPLFLYLELPFIWLGLHAHLSFTVLGKLPIMASDVLTALLIAAFLNERRHGDGTMAVGAALYFLNPLVLYNGAFDGRFDALCVGLLLLALRYYKRDSLRGWAFSLLYAAAVAAKTYPIFILPWLLIRAPRRLRILTALLVVLGGLSLPYLLRSPAQFLYDIVLYNGHRLPSGQTWQNVVRGYVPREVVRVLSYPLLALFGSALVLLTELDLLTYCTVAMLLFLLLSKIVYEQYFLWAFPFLIFDLIERRSRSAGILLAALSALGVLDNEQIHPLRPHEHAVAVMEYAAFIAVDLCILIYVLVLLARLRSRPTMQRQTLDDGAPA
jgi:uncharacterized membrane protein